MCVCVCVSQGNKHARRIYLDLHAQTDSTSRTDKRGEEQSEVVLQVSMKRDPNITWKALHLLVGKHLGSYLCDILGKLHEQVGDGQVVALRCSRSLLPTSLGIEDLLLCATLLRYIVS